MADFSYEELLSKAESIYEAVVIMSLRARQVNDSQKMLIESEMDYTPGVESRENEDFDEVEIDRDALTRERIKYPKPTTVAMEELINNNIQFLYIQPEENSEE